ncbi:HesA/MoeB/ThiF family protein [Dyella sp. A6]|uniref:HesA/MoeB/ThiF family protein n=1 Tax=Dyella aluminiiresistens TaxID=3069105 RepID=UPI002E7700AC|nr:HesA/MoeB/ThiF family protein [Dyella sp. A6]
MSPRYCTQQKLAQVGVTGQQRLVGARVLVVGAGGLGSTLLPLLAGAGVGQLQLVDPDTVELSNLHRQTLYRMDDLGQSKVQAAVASLHALNPQVQVHAEQQALDPANAPGWVAQADVVVDAADQFAVSYALSDACLATGTPLVSASAQALDGYAGVFCGDAPSYRALFPRWPVQAADCASAGVLGPVVAMIGSLQAQLVLALLLKMTPSPCGRLWRWDGQSMAFSQFNFGEAEEPVNSLPLVGHTQLKEDDLPIDLRSAAEAPLTVREDAVRCALPELRQILPELPRDQRLVLTCRSGMRAARAAEQLQQSGFTRLALLAMGEVDRHR